MFYAQRYAIPCRGRMAVGFVVYSDPQCTILVGTVAELPPGVCLLE